MHLKVHFYQLPQSPNFPRAHLGVGVLLALEGENHTFGYADLHPWPTLGDLKVQEQLQLLKQGKPTAQMQRALDYARRDLAAKQSQTTGVQYLKEIKNHHLILDKHITLKNLNTLTTSPVNKDTVSETFKWKISPETAAPVSQVLNQAALELPHLKWRLDANSLFNFKDILQFWKSLSSVCRQKIEFIEDPCPYEKNNWNHLEEEGLPLAIDFEISHWSPNGPLEASDTPTSSNKMIFVLKPAIQKTEDWKSFFKHKTNHFLFTSYLDHPVGLLHALWTAETFAQAFPNRLLACGLNFSFSPSLLETFWNGLYLDKNVWCGKKSPGIGYTQLLEALPWQTLGEM